MKRIILSIALGIGLARASFAQADVAKEAAKLEAQGQFKESAALLQKAIDSKTLSTRDKKSLELQLDILHRIREDYTTSKEQLFKSLKQDIKDLAPSEFDQWIKDGWFDKRVIDGKLLFFDSSDRNIWFIHPELNPRHINAPDKTKRDRKALEVIEAIKTASAAEHNPYVLPKTFHVTMRVAAKADVVTNGELIRAWIPIPRQYPFQDNFKIMSVSWPPESVNPADSPIRAMYFEQPAHRGLPTEFKVEYEYTMRGVHFDLKPADIKPLNSNDPELKRFTSESPHVSFTPEIKALSAKIVGTETNPMLKAKKIYDHLSDILRYSYATEYSTVPNISAYCLSHEYGDCGEQGMLFITLCRYNGIPARWQTGWDLFPGDVSNHDWAEIYLAPYGWVPVDQYMGNHAMRYMTTLTQAQRIEIRDFYFGGIDQYRMIANSDHSIPLSPAKKFPRSDDVDFQRGELETANGNLYLDKFSYSLDYKELPPPVLP